jgi:23S rRNA pseudouridine2605 synthase
MAPPEGVRVQKALADAGVASRRAADALVASGRVTVNGRPAVAGQRVDPLRDVLAVDGRGVARRTAHTYLAMHKPPGVTSTVRDRHATRTVLDLLPPDLRGPGRRLYPVGRLDRDSEGLLLLTDDGDWTQGILHPSHEVEREYAVGTERPLEDEQLGRLLTGVRLDEGLATVVSLRPATAAESRRLPPTDSSGSPGGTDRTGLTWYRVVLRQGWRRQLRRMFAAVGAPVRRLVRVRIGSLRLGSLAPGTVRPLSRAERDRLASGPRRR